jgi:fungal STAND N-terminal Goodbye domain
MSSPAHVSSSPSFQLITDALGDYAKQTGIDLFKDPFAEKIRLFKSPDDILRHLQEREKTFKEYRDRYRTMINCLTPVVKVLHAFSATLGEAVSLVSHMFHIFFPISALLY